MKCLVIGSAGQLGRALQATKPVAMNVVAPPEAECDLTNAAHLERWIADAKPQVIFNAAAYTNVDGAESDAETAELVNATAVRTLADLAKRADALLVHVSTDFIFDGDTSRPYMPEDTPNPLSVYGRTKLGGEDAIAQSGIEALIVRTAWVYAEAGRNFVLTMLRLMAERENVNVVVDQIGTPTYVRNLATCLWRLVEKSARGTFHFTDEGVASWYDFAVAIAEEARAAGLLSKSCVVNPIPASQYPTPAVRPRFSVLDKARTHSLLGGPGQHWRAALRDMLGRMPRM